MKIRLLLVLAALIPLLLSSCNTMGGFGKDLQRAGQGLENTSQGQTW